MPPAELLGRYHQPSGWTRGLKGAALKVRSPPTALSPEHNVALGHKKRKALLVAESYPPDEPPTGEMVGRSSVSPFCHSCAEGMGRPHGVEEGQAWKTHSRRTNSPGLSASRAPPALFPPNPLPLEEECAWRAARRGKLLFRTWPPLHILHIQRLPSAGGDRPS